MLLTRPGLMTLGLVGHTGTDPKGQSTACHYNHSTTCAQWSAYPTMHTFNKLSLLQLFLNTSRRGRTWSSPSATPIQWPAPCCTSMPVMSYSAAHRSSIFSSSSTVSASQVVPPRLSYRSRSSGLRSCGIAELRSCGIAELRSCGVAGLRGCGVARL